MKRNPLTHSNLYLNLSPHNKPNHNLTITQFHHHPVGKNIISSRGSLKHTELVPKGNATFRYISW